LIIIANKVDRLSPEERLTVENFLGEISDARPKFHYLLLSAKTGEGIDTLQKKLLNLVNTGALRNNETIVTNSRHYDALLKALEEIQKVQEGLELGISGDLLAIDIRQALYHFGEITGEITSDDLLGNIFANFCIGK
jgi:tRNA modification GTPase